MTFEALLRDERRVDLVMHALCVIAPVDGAEDDDWAELVAIESYSNVLVRHSYNHALAEAEENENDESVKNNALNEQDEDDQVGAELKRFQNEANIRDRKLDLVVLRRRKTHLLDTLVVDSVTDLKHKALIERARLIGRALEHHSMIDGTGLSLEKQDLGVNDGDEGLPEPVERASRLDDLLRHLFSVVEDDSRLDADFDVKLEEALTMLHRDRAVSAKINSDIVGNHA